MVRNWFVAAAISVLATSAVAQPCVRGGGQAITWGNDLAEGVAQAKKQGLPLLLYVTAASRDRDDDRESQHRKAFSNPQVIEWTRRFIPVRVSRSRYRDQLDEWNAATANQIVLFVTPDGKLIDQLGPEGVGNVSSFSQKMQLVFRKFREDIYNDEVKPKLTADADAAALRMALKRVDHYRLLAADQALAKQLEREDLPADIRRSVFQALAELSTRPAVTALLNRALEEEDAAAALTKCTPAAAEQMLEALLGSDGQVNVLVYQAVTRIAKVPNAKPERFWEGKNDKVKQDEVERVKKLVTTAARKWNDKHAEFR